MKGDVAMEVPRAVKSAVQRELELWNVAVGQYQRRLLEIETEADDLRGKINSWQAVISETTAWLESLKE